MLGDVLDPPASTRPKYALEAPQERPTPGSPFKKALILALVALSSGLLLILPEDGEQSYALDTDAETAVVSGPSTGLDSADGAAADGSPTPSSMTEVAGETGFSSEADTARLALATEAALVGSDPNLAGSALALSLADELALAEQAMAALSPTATTQAPPTTAATSTAPSPTQAATTVPETTAAAVETTDGDSVTSVEDGAAAGPEATDGNTTAPTDGETTEAETATSEAGGSETTVLETTTPETTAPEATVETTAPETTAPATSATDGWVDTGNGVMVPPVLLAIRWCESTDNYTAANPSSSARGAYQFLTGSWDAYGHKDRYGVSQAHLATPVQQDEAALITWERDGTRPWNASKSCWSKRI